jgi:hypothetical protein
MFRASVPIIRKNNYICATPGNCQFVWMTGTQGGLKHCILDSHPYKVTNIKCHIDIVISSDNGHIVARNM